LSKFKTKSKIRLVFFSKNTEAIGKTGLKTFFNSYPRCRYQYLSKIKKDDYVIETTGQNKTAAA
jgi:hypothetical protein